MYNDNDSRKDVIPPMRKNVSLSPHVVILGAGASLAAFPKGDKNGKKLPLMNSLVDTLGLQNIIPASYSHLVWDFEKLYSTLNNDKSCSSVKSKIDQQVYQYFHDLQIPDEPTLYDYLILSLREKDIIATFNWDPLLLQCMRRHAKIKKLPQVVFLHGNVAVGLCYDCRISGYSYNKICHHCRAPFQPMKLLYPIDKKDYSGEVSIRDEWNTLKHHLQYASYTTVFGYSAPASDADAKSLMLESVFSNRSKVFAELEIIDIKNEEEVQENWNSFFHKNHYNIIDDFKKSYLWYHPRRSCDAFFSAYLMNTPWSYNPFPEFKSITEMHKWIEPLLSDEELVKNEDVGFTYKAK